MSSAALSPVSFHGSTLFVTDHNGEPFTPMKPIVEGMGLTWQSQQKKISGNKERWGIIILVIPTASGSQSMLCMPVRKLPAFFASISVNKVRAALRPTIILYQNECDDVLWKHWTGQPQLSPVRPALPSLSTVADRAPLRALVHAWSQVSGQPHQALWAQVKGHFQLSRIDDLPAEWIQDALDFVQGKIDGLQKALPAPEPQPVRQPLPSLPAAVGGYEAFDALVRSGADNLFDAARVIDKSGGDVFDRYFSARIGTALSHISMLTLSIHAAYIGMRRE